MTSQQIILRSDLLGTQVITRSTGKRLGVVSQLWVDVDRREVVALGLRDNIISGVLSGTPHMMLLDSIRQIGDVILVDDDTVLEDSMSIDSYSSLINSEVITETGELLGRVRGFKFDAVSGKVAALTIASIGFPLIPDQIVSTYELPIEEIVSSGPDRLIVFEGAEEKLSQLTVGVLERLGIGKAPWEREDEEYYERPLSTSNQLGTGLRTPAQPMREATPMVQNTWDEDNWGEPEPRRIREPLRQRQVEPAYYDDDLEEENWSDASPQDDYEEAYAYEPEYNEVVEEDVWADKAEPQPYTPPQINIPEKRKVLEYEEEADY